MDHVVPTPQRAHSPRYVRYRGYHRRATDAEVRAQERRRHHVRRCQMCLYLHVESPRETTPLGQLDRGLWRSSPLCERLSCVVELIGRRNLGVYRHDPIAPGDAQELLTMKKNPAGRQPPCEGESKREREMERTEAEALIESV
jgi:hypothetical protein